MRHKKDDIMPTEAGMPLVKDELKKNIAERIRIQRFARHFTAKEVAKRIGMTRVGYSHIESGKNHINGATIWKLATIFGCQPNDFFPAPDHSASKIDKEHVTLIAHEQENAKKWVEQMLVEQKYEN